MPDTPKHGSTFHPETRFPLCRELTWPTARSRPLPATTDACTQAETPAAVPRIIHETHSPFATTFPPRTRGDAKGRLTAAVCSSHHPTRGIGRKASGG